VKLIILLTKFDNGKTVGKSILLIINFGLFLLATAMSCEAQIKPEASSKKGATEKSDTFKNWGLESLS